MKKRHSDKSDQYNMHNRFNHAREQVSEVYTIRPADQMVRQIMRILFLMNKTENFKNSLTKIDTVISISLSSSTDLFLNVSVWKSTKKSLVLVVRTTRMNWNSDECNVDKWKHWPHMPCSVEIDFHIIRTVSIVTLIRLFEWCYNERAFISCLSQNK